MTDTPTTERAKATASTAADEGKHVAGVAQEQASSVATEAAQQARSLAGEAQAQVTDQLAEQSRQQRDKLVGTLGTLGDDLHRMADQGEGGLAADVAREVAGHARSLTSYLDGREPGELLDDVRDFARRRPGTFLAGALVAGLVAGRLARGVKDSPSGPGSSTGGSAAQPTGTTPMYGAPPPTSPPAPTTPPPVTPATTTAAPPPPGLDLPSAPPGTHVPPANPIPGTPT
jgi:hypothetical protein